MGSSASIHTVEVSFIDSDTGNMLSDSEIKDLSKEAVAFVDFSSKFYEPYKNPNSYAVWAQQLREGVIDKKKKNIVAY